MAQEVRDYVEAVLNSLSANVPKVSSVDIYMYGFCDFYDVSYHIDRP